jgi:hypothetical protein
MGEIVTCPTCEDALAKMTTVERAMVHLRHAANEFRAAWDAVFDRTVEIRYPATETDQKLKELTAAAAKADDALADAAIAYTRAVDAEASRKR